MLISYPTLTYIVKNKLIKELSFAIKIKRLYGNSVIYKANIKNLPSLLLCSRSKVNRAIKIIIDNDWGYWSKQNLVLRSGRAIHDILTETTSGKLLQFIQIRSIEDIQLEILKNKLRQQEFVNNHKSNLESNSLKKSNSGKKAVDFFRGEKGYIKDEQINTKIGTGLETLSKVYCYSEGYTGYLMRYLERCGLITIKRHSPQLIDCIPNMDKRYIPKGYFLKNNCFLYKRKTNTINAV